MHFRIKKGLNLPLRGEPDSRIENASGIKNVAVLGSDYIGLKPTMLVREGDQVQLGQALFEDKKNPGVIVSSPASGTVSKINRGAKRVLISVVIEVDEENEASVQFFDPSESDLNDFDDAQVKAKLQESGLWTAFRTRPYGKVPTVDAQPHSVFVNAMDTNPLSPDPAFIIGESATDFVLGVSVLNKLGAPVYVCSEHGSKLPELKGANIKGVTFSGPHPAGLPSTHVHMVDPVHANKSVWTIGYQDVMTIGALFATGKLDVTRYIALAGPMVTSPRIFKTRAGANLSELCIGRMKDGQKRIISGSVLHGHHAKSNTEYLGRYANQISVIEEDTNREFMGWIAPGAQKFSAINVFLSSLFKPGSFNITSSQNGSPRAIVPIGVYEKVMPLDILPTPLVKALLVKDTDAAQELGCLELVEEDMALCSFVDPGKHDFAPVLRSTLTQIEKEG
ncbi:MAG: Na(+)-translocating NADH-quinone reductase subunit A [Pseudomonadota bacterium]